MLDLKPVIRIRHGEIVKFQNIDLYKKNWTKMIFWKKDYLSLCLKHNHSPKLYRVGLRNM